MNPVGVTKKHLNHQMLFLLSELRIMQDRCAKLIIFAFQTQMK